MNKWPEVEVSKTVAKRALSAAAFTETHRHCDTCTCDVPPDRQVVHSRLAGIGADHTLAYALEVVEQADEIKWVTGLLRHDLFVRVGLHEFVYDVARPERSL